MGCDDPKSVVLSFKGLNRSALVQVPDTNGLVFPNGKNEVLMRMEETRRGVLEMTSTSIDLPSFGLCKQLA